MSPADSGPYCPDYGPSAAANWVLEVKGGFSEAHDIGVGTSIDFH